MIGVDTNILLYAMNPGAAEHGAARAWLEGRRRDPEVVLSELVLVELYVSLRNAAIVRRPLGAAAAASIVERLRRHPHWQLVDHEPSVMTAVWRMAGTPGFARRRIFDARLALGLVRHGVTRLATRNTGDFEGMGFVEVFDPL